MEDQQARYFHFRKQRAELNWQQMHMVDLDELVANVDTATLERVRVVGVSEVLRLAS